MWGGEQVQGEQQITGGSININGSSNSIFVRGTKQKHLTFLETSRVQMWEVGGLSFASEVHRHPHGDDWLCKSGVQPRVRDLPLRPQHLMREQELKLRGQRDRAEGERVELRLAPGLRHFVWPL